MEESACRKAGNSNCSPNLNVSQQILGFSNRASENVMKRNGYNGLQDPEINCPSPYKGSLLSAFNTQFAAPGALEAQRPGFPISDFNREWHPSHSSQKWFVAGLGSPQPPTLNPRVLDEGQPGRPIPPSGVIRSKQDATCSNLTKSNRISKTSAGQSSIKSEVLRRSNHLKISASNYRFNRERKKRVVKPQTFIGITDIIPKEFLQNPSKFASHTPNYIERTKIVSSAKTAVEFSSHSQRRPETNYNGGILMTQIKVPLKTTK